MTTAQVVANEFRQKMQLERIFTPEVRSVFARQFQAFRASVANTGTFKPTNSSDWIAPLKKHYTRTQKRFSGAVETQQKAFTIFEIKQLDAQEQSLLLLASVEWADVNSEESSALMTATTNRDMQASLDKAREIAQEEGLPQDNLTIAAMATALLRRKFRGRTGGITSSETQGPAESTKLFDAELLAGGIPSILQTEPQPETTSTKQWWTVGDSIVRDIHKAANRQIVNIATPFIVNGERLNHPGDRSQGASAKNTIHCRCSGVYNVA